MKIGITGTIASGKTSVSILFRRMGFSVFNADNYAKMATHASNPCFQPLLEVLSEDVLDESGDIDRKKMASIIFNDEEKRKAVNAIVFAEIPLLFEANLEEEFDKVLVVTCDKDTAIKRMEEDREYTRQEALDRYASQVDPSLQVEKADFVIENNGDLKELGSKVNQFVAQTRKEIRRGA